LPGYFHFERNEPCPCLSGRKYKKCCMNRLEDYYRRFKSLRGWLEPEFAEALAALCGLQAEGDERVPEAEEIDEALELIEKGFLREEDEDNRFDFMYNTLSDFAGMLAEDDSFRHIRFTLKEVDDFMGVLDSKLETPDEEPGKDELEVFFLEALDEWLPRVVSEEDNRGLAWAIFDGLRERSYPLSERTALVTALMVCLQNKRPVDNPIWEAIVRVSVDEIGRIQEELERLKGRAASNTVEMERLMGKYPMLKEDISEKILSMTAPALKCIDEGKISFELPAYAVLGGLLTIFKVLDEVKDWEGLDKELFEWLENAGVQGAGEFSGIFYKAVFVNAWETDYDIFVAAANHFFEDWLAGEGRNAGEEVRDSVEKLMCAIGDGYFESTRLINVFLYSRGILNALERGKTALAEWGDAEGPGIALENLLTAEGLEVYAGYLEGKENAFAAEHVRQVAGKYF